MIENLSIWQALKIVIDEISKGKKEHKIRLIKQDGTRYRVVDGQIIEVGKQKELVPLIVDISDTWTVLLL